MVMTINNIWTIGVADEITRSDWRVYTRAPYTDDNLLYSIDRLDGNLLEHHDIIRLSDGTIYPPENGSVARVRIWFGVSSSSWFDLDGGNCDRSGLDSIDNLLHNLSISKGIIDVSRVSGLIQKIKE